MYWRLIETDGNSGAGVGANDKKMINDKNDKNLL